MKELSNNLKNISVEEIHHTFLKAYCATNKLKFSKYINDVLAEHIKNLKSNTK